MTTVTVTTQDELDAALATHGDDVDAEIIIDSPEGEWLKVTAYVPATVFASGSSSVHASGSANVYAHDSARVYATDSTYVTAYGSASVTATGSANVHVFDSARVTTTR